MSYLMFLRLMGRCTYVIRRANRDTIENFLNRDMCTFDKMRIGRTTRVVLITIFIASRKLIQAN